MYMFVNISIRMHTGDTNDPQSSTLKNKHENQTSYVYFQRAEEQQSNCFDEWFDEKNRNAEHAATHCIKLQHTATHCSTLQNAMQGKGSYVDE